MILSSGQWNRQPDLVFADPVAIAAAKDSAGSEIPGAWTLPEVIATGQDADVVDGQAVYAVVVGQEDPRTGSDRHRLEGSVAKLEEGRFRLTFGSIESPVPPDLSSQGAYFSFKGATLTAKAFDRAIRGFGKWIVPLVAWMFAISTMISWSYYGEQGVRYMFKERGITTYRAVYCALIFVSATPLIRTEDELDVISTLGTGVMLFANIPIMLVFGAQAMRAYRRYFDRLDRGEMKGHAFPKLSDVIEGDDVE